MKAVIGIDVGGSTTKIVGFRYTENGAKELIPPQFVQANDPLTSIYGAFGKFTAENGLALSDISKIMVTGVGASYLKGDLYGLPCYPVPEFTAIGVGGLYLSGLPEAVIVSMGTGTAIVHAKESSFPDGAKMRYLGGTGVGGGTLIGLSKLLLDAETIPHIEALAAEGDLSKIDLRVGDLTGGKDGVLDSDVTASNFGKIADGATKEDVASGIFNLVYETIGMVSVFSARSVQVKDVILTGNLTTVGGCAEKFDSINHMGYGVNFRIPKMSQYATVIGTALCG